MANCIREKEYHCSDDCEMSGCPGHKGILNYQSVSDAYKFDNGKGEIKYFERGELEAFIQLLKDLNRADSVQL